MSVWIDVACLCMLILLNGFFAMSEIAIVTARRSKLQVLADEKAPGARLALALSENPTRALSTIQVGITSIGILSGIVGESALVEPLSRLIVETFAIAASTARAIAMVGVVVAITYFSIVIGELVPKRIGQLAADSLARFVAKPISWLAVIAMPFVRLLSMSTELLMKWLGIRDEGQQITEEEIHTIIDEGSQTGVIDKQEHTMVRNVFRLDDRPVSSLMVPRSEVEFIDLEDPQELNMEKLLQSNHSHLPVCEGGLDDVKGIVTTRELLKQMVATGKADFHQQFQSVVYLPESLTGMEVLDNFRASGCNAALVIDEYGAVLGLVTPRDVLEAIAGEFKPDAPEDAQIIPKGEGRYEIDGLLPIPELKDLLKISEVPGEAEDRYTTVGGMMMFMLERLPRVGDIVKWEGWQFTLTAVDGRRADRILVVQMPQNETESTEE